MRFPVADLQSISALIPSARRGIYVLEFSNGEFYVGQAKNVVTRFAQHRHGNTNHVEPWGDIEKLWFMPVSEELSLNTIEYQEIQRFRQEGKILRNRALNLGHEQPSKLNKVIPVEDQQSWVLGAGPYDLAGAEGRIPELADARTKFEKMVPEDFQEPILRDLAFALRELIPSAVELEGQYWTLSDCPETSGGRWATLNTGFVELLFFPRLADLLNLETGDFEQFEGVAWLNTLPGTLLDQKDEYVWCFEYQTASGEELVADYFRMEYPSTDSDVIEFSVGDLEAICRQYPSILEGARGFALQAMRQNTSGMFRRWHSKALVRAVYMNALGHQ